MKKYNYLSARLAVGLLGASNFGFAAIATGSALVSATVTPTVYYCNNLIFNTSNCLLENTGQLIPSQVAISSEADAALEVQNPGEVGAVMLDAAGMVPGPSVLWSYTTGTGVPISGIAMSNSSTLAGVNDPGLKIDVNAYYVPCGATPSRDGQLSGAPTGQLLGATATSIQNSSQNCSTGGNIYLKFTPQPNTLDRTGFITPDTYSGEVYLTVMGLSGSSSSSTVNP